MSDRGHVSAPAEVDRLRQSPDRLLTFTDGVFAIIITILVLDIRVPANLSERSLADAVDEVGPTMVAWVISFLITGMYWVWHRDVFAMVRRVSRGVVWLNLLFLVPVALIPFAASVLGEYSRSPTALHLYGAVLVTASLFRAWLFLLLASRPQLLVEELSARARRFGVGVALGPVVVYLLAMAVAGVAPVASLVLYALIPLLYFLGISVLRSRSQERDEADQYS